MKGARRKHFLLSSYSNEFGIKPHKVLGFITTINGFWFLRHYKDHYRGIYREFKNAVLYKQTMECNYFILIQNLNYDLTHKKECLEKQYAKIRKGVLDKRGVKQKSSLASKLKYYLQFYSSSRRLRYCYNVQIRYLNLSLLHCYAIAKNAKIELTEANFTLAEGEQSILTKLNWTGSKLEFLQWAYALLKSDRVNQGKVELRKSVELLAKFFNVEIGKANFSDLSKSIHQYNDDYFPPIFEDLSKAYLHYINLQKQKRAE